MHFLDLDYPESLHDLHQDYRLGPESVQISQDMLSKKQRQMLTDRKGKFKFMKP